MMSDGVPHVVCAETGIHLPPLNTRRRCCSNIGGGIATTTTTITRRIRIMIRKRGNNRNPPPSIIQALPPPLLLQPPQRPEHLLHHHHQIKPPKANTNDDDKKKKKKSSEEEEEEDSTTTSVSDVLRLMDILQIPVEADMYLYLFKECTHSRDATQGAMVHAHIIHHQPDTLTLGGLLLANRLLLMYAACGRPGTARHLFDQMPVRDIISWATMIASLSDNGNHREARQLFVEMHGEEEEEDTTVGGSWLVEEPASSCCVLVAAVLRSCVHARDLGFGEQVHGLILKTVGNASSSRYSSLGSSLIQLYGMLGRQRGARQVFECMHHRNTAAWTHMISTYCREDLLEAALGVFREMGRAGKRKDCFTFSSVLMACARRRMVGDEEGWRCGRQVHAVAIKAGVESEQFVWSSLIHMYGNSGHLKDARRAF